MSKDSFQWKYKKFSGFKHLGMKKGLTLVLTVGAGTNTDPKARDNESSRRRLQKKWMKRGRRNMIKRDTNKQIKDSINE